MNKPLSGIYVALTTPYVGEEVAPDKIQENIGQLNDIPLAGYLVLGSTGESVYLNDEESEKLLAAVIRAADSGRKILVGTARESTRATIEFTNRMASVGGAAALVRPPAYFKSRMTREALKRHYLSLADNSHIPILIYNIPQNTGISLDPDLVVELARHPNITGLKESSGSLAFLGETAPRTPEDFHYFLGSGHVVYPGLEMGADGAILAVANAAPEICSSLFELFREGRKKEALELQVGLIPLNKAVPGTYGIAGLKYAQDLRGYYGGPARAPLLPVEENGRKEIAAILRNLRLIP